MENNIRIYTEFKTDIPKLYHYTSFTGIQGIIDKKELWFTNIHYLNDSTEYTYALQIIKEIVDRQYDFGDDEDFIKIFPSSQEIEPIFSFSLSEKKDLLSQWRGYCPNGGYSISFFDKLNFEQMDRMLKAKKLYIGKCLYEKADIEKFVQERIIGLSPELFKANKSEALMRNEDKEWLVAIYTRLVYNTIKYAPLIKHKAFKEEKEWRIVANFADSTKIQKSIDNFIATALSSTEVLLTWGTPTSYVPFADLYEILEFRPGRSFLIPYLKIPLALDNAPVFIKEVIVGPTPHMELSIKACKLLLKDNLANVKPSKLPYRNW